MLGGGGDLQQRPVAAAPPGELQPGGQESNRDGQGQGRVAGQVCTGR